MSDRKSDQPNLDLIQMVQRARMQHDSDAKPSDIQAVYWIEAKAPSGTTPDPTPRAGEWRIQTTVAAVDALWETIRAATVAGELGYKSKVSTRPGPGQSGDDARLICVRTADADDSADVQRVRDALARLNVTANMAYHRDQAGE